MRYVSEEKRLMVQSSVKIQSKCIRWNQIEITLLLRPSCTCGTRLFTKQDLFVGLINRSMPDLTNRESTQLSTTLPQGTPCQSSPFQRSKAQTPATKIGSTTNLAWSSIDEVNFPVNVSFPVMLWEIISRQRSFWAGSTCLARARGTNIALAPKSTS